MDHKKKKSISHTRPTLGQLRQVFCACTANQATANNNHIIHVVLVVINILVAAHLCSSCSSSSSFFLVCFCSHTEERGFGRVSSFGKFTASDTQRGAVLLCIPQPQAHALQFKSSRPMQSVSVRGGGGVGARQSCNQHDQTTEAPPFSPEQTNKQSQNQTTTPPPLHAKKKKKKPHTHTLVLVQTWNGKVARHDQTTRCKLLAQFPIQVRHLNRVQKRQG